jgi:hypothetical protein
MGIDSRGKMIAFRQMEKKGRVLKAVVADRILCSGWNRFVADTFNVAFCQGHQFVNVLRTAPATSIFA